MKNLLIVSDSHHNHRILKDLSQKYPAMDYYLHLGDSELYQDEIAPFLGVRGNNDYDLTFPSLKVLKIEDLHFLMVHGHYYRLIGNNDGLISKAKEQNCQVVLFGHTHVPYDEIHKGIRLINPGSLSYNRDGSSPSYIIARVEKDKLDVHFYHIKYPFDPLK